MTKKVNISTTVGADVAHVSQAVAGRLKEFRKHKKLTLDELSKRSGVSKGMLVEIEKGYANPSIAILCKISASLGVSVADFVNVSSRPTINIVGPEGIPTLWNGPHGGSAKLLAGTTGPSMIELWRWHMLPGESYESSGHPSGTYELIHVLEGELHLQVGENDLTIPCGSSAIAKTEDSHSYSCLTDKPVIFMMAVSELH
ncbi:helix-turn-helix transcriptional regulator [Aquitalea sp. LB_tupeE]|uniref:helix-turn-helix domain-containing protein n=1 Tax=Aquitalea sp. LB_tupeE TaxID=2748078 RepID=UPI0015BF30B6|nr:helix-turn-helix transcriptional regulator [Aquitalea sp. LB_tupeE]NWK78817.1 helix-turn-helix domain-containing protein [Aquitalea sp. LB_tupeE]